MKVRMKASSIGLHDYISRTRRIEVVDSSSDRHRCRLAWEPNEFELNDTAFAVLSLCDGRTTLCTLILQLKAELGLPAAQIPAVQGEVQQVLGMFLRMGIVRSSPAPGDSVGIVAAKNPVLAADSARTFPASIQVINLSYRTDRWRAFSSALSRAGAPEFQRLEAVDAEAYPTVTAMLEAHDYRLSPCYLDVPGFDDASHRFKAKTGCALSHQKAFRNIVASEVAGWHVIFEDDDKLLHDWTWLVDSFAETLERHPGTPDMVLLSNRVGIARPDTGINDRFGCDAYAVHSSACAGLIESMDFSTGGFHVDYSPDNHCYHLCEEGRLDIAILADGPWAYSVPGGGASDIER